MIKGNTLRDAFISAANHIGNNRQQVDALNVFPVPDGDTGTNMSMTISAAKRELERLGDDVTVGEVAQTAAAALLRGARGNSGVILSLLFRGFAKSLAGKKEAGAKELADALTMGVEAAYKAVMKPTEGTILTVARLGAEHAQEVLTDDMEPIVLWREILSAAREALAQTPELLPVLKKAGVVDAGGKGLVVIFEGMERVLAGGEMIQPEDAPAVQTQTVEPSVEMEGMDLSEYEGDIEYAYCTEFIVLKAKDGPQKSPLALRAYLESIGDSVVVVDDADIIKVHVHTENPGNALQEALTYGRLTNLKIENMQEQFERLYQDAARKKAEAQAAAEPQQAQFAYQPVDPDRQYGFVAVAAGEGIRQLFLDLGVDNVVSGGQTMNPSTDDILSAVQATPAKTVFVLPNNKNIIMAAEQTIKLADRKVCVLPTRTIPQGLSAMLAFDGSSDTAANQLAMTKAFERVGTGQITFAARDSDFDGHKIKKGEILALENGKVSFTEKDIVKAAVRVTKNLIRKELGGDANFITILYGQDVTEEQAAQVEAAIKSKVAPDVEIAVVNGGQPIYYFTISVE